MARPVTITDEQIIEAARAVFLEKGLRATTAEVARRAGVAEGSIFNRFKTKEGLFRAAMQLGPDEEPPWVRRLAGRVGQGDVREALSEIGMEVVEFFRTLLPVMMMEWSHKAETDEAGVPRRHPGDGAAPLRMLKRIAGYFEAEMQAGRLRRHDPEIVARTFLGSIQNFVFFELMTRSRDELPLPAETFLRGLVKMLWDGVAPIVEGGGAKAKAGRRALARRS